MPDGDIRHFDPRSDARAAGGLGVFQFSLTSVFVIMTVMALILSIYFSVGRLVGMSTTDVLMQGFSRLLFAIPTLLVWTVGLTMAIRRLKQYRVPATLTIIALGGLILTYLVFQVIQMALLHMVNSSQISSGVLGWSFTYIGVINVVINTALWILIITAIFIQRPADAADI